MRINVGFSNVQRVKCFIKHKKAKHINVFCLFMHVRGLADIDRDIQKLSVNAVVHMRGFFLAALLYILLREDGRLIT